MRVALTAIPLVMLCGQAFAAVHSVSIPSDGESVSIKYDPFSDEPVEGKYVETYTVNMLPNSNERNGAFNADAKKIGVTGKISNCSMLISVSAGKNTSFGGFCKITSAGKTTDIQLCNDVVVNHFALIHSPALFMNKAGLIEFTMSNCFGG